MMNTRKAIPLLAMAALVLLLTLPAHGQTGIIVNNADTVREEGVSLDAGLSSITGSVSPHVVLQYANTKREERIAVPPTDLQALFAQVPARVVLQYANTKREERIAVPPADLQALFVQVSARVILQYANTMRQAALAAPPGELRTLFGQVADRIILQYANTNRQVTLAYPVALIGDTVPPQIRDVRTQNVAGGVKVTWTTDEFATSAVRYGAAPGTYTQTAADPLFDKSHSLTLTGLTAGRTYYFVVRGADRSGNQAISGEYQVRTLGKMYLPMIRRR
jgi:hypothetical protein